MSEQLDNLTVTRTHGKLGGAYTPEQRERKQKRFLKAFSETGNVKHSCKVASISRQTYYDWRDNDEDFKSQLPDVKEEANDTLEYAAHERAVHGVEEPVVSQGQLVYEYEPLLDENGDQRFDDKFKPLMKRGKQIVIRKYSDTLLIKLLTANMPHKYRDKSSVEVSGPNGGPVQHENSDLKLLNDEELDLVERTLLQAKERSGAA